MKVKKVWLILAVLALVAAAVAVPVVSASNGATASSPVLVVSPLAVNMNSKAQAVIMGSGFQPGKEVRLMLPDKLGGTSEIWAGNLDIHPIVANDRGNWVAVWTVGDFSKSAVTAVGVNCMIATDENYKTLVSVPFGFYNAKDPWEKWPAWAQVLVPKPVVPVVPK